MLLLMYCSFTTSAKAVAFKVKTSKGQSRNFVASGQGKIEA